MIIKYPKKEKDGNRKGFPENSLDSRSEKIGVRRVQDLQRPNRKNFTCKIYL